jgi:hypothetical protein
MDSPRHATHVLDDPRLISPSSATSSPSVYVGEGSVSMASSGPFPS